jgi:hypothetical protein
MRFNWETLAHHPEMEDENAEEIYPDREFALFGKGLPESPEKD